MIIQVVLIAGIALAAALMMRGPAHRQLQELFDGEMPLGQVCDVLGYALPLSVEMKQGLLAEAHAGRRAQALIDALRSSAARTDRPFPPGFSPN